MSIYSYGRAISQKECAWEHSSLICGLLKIQQGPGRAYYRRLSICQLNQYNHKYWEGTAVYFPLAACCHQFDRLSQHSGGVDGFAENIKQSWICRKHNDTHSTIWLNVTWVGTGHGLQTTESRYSWKLWNDQRGAGPEGHGKWKWKKRRAKG